jgi:hypothetical protein
MGVAPGRSAQRHPSWRASLAGWVTACWAQMGPVGRQREIMALPLNDCMVGAGGIKHAGRLCALIKKGCNSLPVPGRIWGPMSPLSHLQKERVSYIYSSLETHSQNSSLSI